MNGKIATAVLAASLSMAAALPAFAGQWEKNGTGWWYNYGDGTYPANTWEWIDSDQDGKAECYRFDGNGYVVVSATTADGYQVNEQGAWVVDGAIQTKALEEPVGQEPAHDTMMPYRAYLDYPREENSAVIASFSTRDFGDGYAPSRIIDRGSYYEITSGYIFGPYIIPESLLATPIVPGTEFTLYLSDQNKNVSSAIFRVNHNGYFDYLDADRNLVLENCYARENQMCGPADWGFIYDKIYQGSLYIAKDCQVISDYTVTFQEYITQYQELSRFEYGKKRVYSEIDHGEIDEISCQAFPAFDPNTGIIVKLYEHIGV